MFTPPLRPLTPETTAGFECIEFARDVLEIELLPWQRWLLIHALELLPDGSFRFRTVVLLVARQNGKSTLMQVLTLWRMYVDGAPLVIGTAQDLDTAEEQWESVVSMAEEVPDLAAEVAQVSKVNGKKFLRLLSGVRYKVRAASRRGGRGLSGDLVLLDELREHQTFAAWGAVTKTTMARHRAQVWAASNAGDRESVVLTFLRRLAHLVLGDPDGLWTEEEKAEAARYGGVGVVPAGGRNGSVADDLDEEGGEEDGDEFDEFDEAAEEVDGDSLGIFEWSAEPGCDVWDRDGWAQANPSLGYTITERALASAARTDPEATFRTECLCQWVDQMVESLVPAARWKDCEDADSEIVGLARFALDVAPDRSWAAIGAAGARADGLPHVEVTANGGLVDHRPGTEWVVPRAVELSRNNRGVVLHVVKGSAAMSLVPELTAAGVAVEVLPGEQVASACGLFFDKATTEGLRHLGNPELAEALRSARKQQEDGEKAWVFGRRKSSSDITALYAVALALWALLQSSATPVSVYNAGNLDDCDECLEEPAVVDDHGDYLCRRCYERRNGADAD